MKKLLAGFLCGFISSVAFAGHAVLVDLGGWKQLRVNYDFQIGDDCDAVQPKNCKNISMPVLTPTPRGLWFVSEIFKKTKVTNLNFSADQLESSPDCKNIKLGPDSSLYTINLIADSHWLICQVIPGN